MILFSESSTFFIPIQSTENYYNNSEKRLNSLPQLYQMRPVCFYLKSKNGKVMLDYYIEIVEYLKL